MRERERGALKHVMVVEVMRLLLAYSAHNSTAGMEQALVSQRELDMNPPTVISRPVSVIIVSASIMITVVR